jgi:putative ABC transport system permease protein
MMRAALGALLSHWWRHPVQLGMVLVGLSLATGLWTGVQAINSEARASYAQAASVLAQDRLERIVAADGGDIAQADYVALRREGWRVAPLVEGRARFGDVRVTVIGVDPLTMPPQSGLAAGPGAGAEPASEDGDAAGGLADFMRPPGMLLGASDTLSALAPDALPTGMARQVAAGVPPGTVITDIGLAQAMLGLQGRLSRLLLVPGGEGPGPLPANLRRAPPQDEGDLARMTDSFHLNLTAFGFLSFAVGLFIVHAAVGLAFEQRRAVFRTLRALGLPARRLIVLLLAELGLMALVAGAAGVALGWLVAALLLPDVAATLGGLYGAALPGGLSLRAEWWGAGLAIALIGTLAAGARALWLVGRVPVLAPAQPRAWSRVSERALAVQGAAAAGLAIGAVALALWGSAVLGGLVAGFALLAAVLLAAALALPVMLSILLAAAARVARGPVSQWFWADARQQLPGLSLALMALLLALAANVGVGTMVASFRTTFTGWLDQRLAAELYVTARTAPEAVRLRDWLADDPRIEAVLPVWSIEAEVSGLPGDIYAMADHPTYRDAWPLIAAGDAPWDRIADGSAVLVNEQLARRAGLWPGSRIALPNLGTLPVAAVYSDYGNPRGQVIVGLARFVAAYPEAPRLGHALRLRPEDSAAVQAALIDDFGLPPDRVTNQAAAKALSLRIFERTFAVTGALNALTLGVAALALVSSFVMLSGMRLAQVAPLWAMGLTRARLARLELLRALALGAFTAAAALPAGLMLAWVLLAVVNVEAFGWRLPMRVFPADWLRLGAWSMLAVLVAAVVPVWQLARTQPAALVRVFANER